MARIQFVLVGIGLYLRYQVAIVVFTQVWNEFFLALSSRQTQTVQVGMAEAKGTTLVLYNL